MGIRKNWACKRSLMCLILSCVPVDFQASTLAKFKARVVQTLDDAIHWINHYLVDKYQGNQLHYPLDREIYAVGRAIHLLNNWGQLVWQVMIGLFAFLAVLFSSPHCLSLSVDLLCSTVLFPGRRVLPVKAYTGRLHQKMVPLFLGFKYMKGYRLYQLKYLKGRKM